MNACWGNSNTLSKTKENPRNGGKLAPKKYRSAFRKITNVSKVDFEPTFGAWHNILVDRTKHWNIFSRLF